MAAYQPSLQNPRSAPLLVRGGGGGGRHYCIMSPGAQQPHYATERGVQLKAWKREPHSSLPPTTRPAPQQIISLLYKRISRSTVAKTIIQNLKPHAWTEGAGGIKRHTLNNSPRPLCYIIRTRDNLYNIDDHPYSYSKLLHYLCRCKGNKLTIGLTGFPPSLPQLESDNRHVTSK